MSSNRRILLVSEDKGFMVNAMIKNLNEEGFDVTIEEPKLTVLSNMEDRPEIILLYLDAIDDQKQNELLVYMRDLTIESNGRIQTFLIGNDDELEMSKKVISFDSVTGVFKRPLNVKELVDRISQAADEADAESVKKHILVVDDDSTMLRTLKLWLSDKYRVFMANSGMNAISLLAKNKVDLILLDYEMPVANGPQVLSMIRSEPTTKDTPVMFLTAKNDKESVMSVMDLKPEKYLLKTMPAEALLQNIDEFFESQKGKKIK